MPRLICIRRINQTALSFVKVIDMPEHNPGQMGGTMRLGLRKTLFRTNHSLMSKFHISGLLTLFLPLRTRVVYSLNCLYTLVAYSTNTMDPDQTAP